MPSSKTSLSAQAGPPTLHNAAGSGCELCSLLASLSEGLTLAHTCSMHARLRSRQVSPIRLDCLRAGRRAHPAPRTPGIMLSSSFAACVYGLSTRHLAITTTFAYYPYAKRSIRVGFEPMTFRL
jgi:hypothetical protein